MRVQFYFLRKYQNVLNDQIISNNKRMLHNSLKVQNKNCTIIPVVIFHETDFYIYEQCIRPKKKKFKCIKYRSLIL